MPGFYQMADGFFGSAVNRAYHAVFYAASALLLTQGLARSKHSGVVAAFRQHFVKPGIIETEYSRIYERLLDDRQIGDYDVEAVVEPDLACSDVEDARRLVRRSERYLQQGGWL